MRLLQLSPVSLLLLLSFFSLLLCQPFSTGYFATPNTTSSSYFNSWLTPINTYQLAFQLRDSNNNQVFIPNFVSTISLRVYNSTYQSSRSVQVSLSLPFSSYKYSINQWNFTQQLATVQTLENNTINSTYQCYYGGIAQNFGYAGQINLYFNNGTYQSFDPCYFSFDMANLQYTFGPSTLPLYLSLLYIIIGIQTICASLIIYWKYKLIIRIRRLAPISVAALAFYISNRSVVIGYMIGSSVTSSFINFMVLTFLNIFLCLLVTFITFRIVCMYFQTEKARKWFIGIYTSLLICLIFASFYIFWVNFWIYIVLPGVCFLAQSVRNWMQRKTKLKIYYSYYLGLVGINFFESLYYFACPNIFLLPVTVETLLVWSLVWAAIIVGFALQFKYLFPKEEKKEWKSYNDEMQQFNKFLQDYEKCQIAQPAQILDTVRFSKLSQMKNLNITTGKLKPTDTQNFMIQLTYDILNLEKIEVKEEVFEKDQPDCPICYTLLTEKVQEAPDGKKASAGAVEKKFGDLVIKTDCKHYYHYECVLYFWYQAEVKQCPMCRARVSQLGAENIIKVKIKK